MSVDAAMFISCWHTLAQRELFKFQHIYTYFYCHGQVTSSFVQSFALIWIVCRCWYCGKNTSVRQSACVHGGVLENKAVCSAVSSLFSKVSSVRSHLSYQLSIVEFRSEHICAHLGSTDAHTCQMSQVGSLHDHFA